MRPFIVLLLSCIPVIAADTGIRVVSTVKTNAESGVVYTTETFTRDGQTNLVRITKSVDAKVAVRIQEFYHDKKMVALLTHWAQPESESFNTVEHSSYTLGLDFSATRNIETLSISTNKVIVVDGYTATNPIANPFYLDSFTATNGVFYPISDSELQMYNR